MKSRRKAQPTGPRVVALFRAGNDVKQIAAELGVGPAAVRAHLRAAGVRLRQGRPRTPVAADKRFAAAWNVAPGLDALTARLGLTREQVWAQATRFQRRGVELKRIARMAPAGDQDGGHRPPAPLGRDRGGRRPPAWCEPAAHLSSCSAAGGWGRVTVVGGADAGV